MNVLMHVRRTLDRLTIYLPLILFAFLALGSWWLVRSMPELLPPGIDKQLRQDPDYRLVQFTVKSFDASGHMTREVSGQSATHYPATKALHIEDVRIFFENDVGTRLNAQAQKGISLEAEQQVILSGNAVAVRTADAQGPRMTLQGEALTVLLKEERMISSLPIRITRGRDVFTAQTMNLDTRGGQYELKGRVKSVLAPGGR
ncbi:LPS export ABC transporter periplasmic protein LptC, partial [uncultured Limnohabitans sp.]|uniref:LPS export ABC transporter periplasmic protein LptC n=1 Tax=uncultured Limnohabitans sp. TaxID=768543 RepID=UPI00260890D2